MRVEEQVRKPTFYLYNIGGDWLGIQLRLQEEGFKTVAYYDLKELKDKKRPGNGLIECVDDEWKPINDFKDHKDDLIIIMDDNGKGNMADFLRSEGYPVIGSSCFSEHVEYDRGAGNDLAEGIGLNLPPTHHFTEFSAAEAFLSTQDPMTGFFFKGDGYDLAGSSKTYGAKNVEDMQRYLTWVAADCVKKGLTIDSFELQETVDGIEIDVARWYDGNTFAPTSVICFEQKKTGGLGAAQGCMGQVITYMPVMEPYGTYFKRLQPSLDKTGPNEWAINALVSHTDRQPYFLEWTPRFGWDATFGELALLQDAGISLSQFFMRLAYGRGFPDGWFPVGRYSAALRLFSEYPGTPPENVCGKPLWVDPSIEKNVWFYGVNKEEDTYTITDCAFAVITACGDTPEEAIAAVYAMADPKAGLITTPDLFYSHSVGKGVPDAIRTLKGYGILDEY